MRKPTPEFGIGPIQPVEKAFQRFSTLKISTGLEDNYFPGNAGSELFHARNLSIQN